MKSLTVGLGEVGIPIAKIFHSEGLDTGRNILPNTRNFEVMHVCIPFSDKFLEIVKRYQSIYQPTYTIIHSTVPIGTSRKLNALHSPIRGLHPNLLEGIKTFPKFIGGEQGSLVADYFRRAGLKIVLCDKQETTELAKLLDTEYYRSCIEFTLRADKLCHQFDVPFAEAYTLFNLTYNEGYKKLGFEEFVRPTLQPMRKPIEGHCLMPNKELLSSCEVP